MEGGSEVCLYISINQIYISVIYILNFLLHYFREVKKKGEKKSGREGSKREKESLLKIGIHEINNSK